MASTTSALPMDRFTVTALLGAAAVMVGHLQVLAEIRPVVTWFAGGVGAGLLLRWGSGALWPMPLGAALMAVLLGYPLPGALLPAVAAFSGAFLLAAWMERREFPAAFGRNDYVLRFVAMALPAAALPPLISSAGLALLGWDSGIPDPMLRIATWWCHSAIAMLLLAPAVATVSRGHLRAWLDDPGMTALLLASLVALVASMVLLPEAVVGTWVPPLCVIAVLVATIRRDLVFGSLYALLLVTAFLVGVSDSPPGWVFGLVLAASVLVCGALMTGRAAAQRRVAEAEEHRRIALLEAATQEQQRIGRDLHDTLGQELTAIALMARALESRMASTAGAAALVPAANAVVRRCAQLVETARRVSRELLTPVDDVAREFARLRTATGGVAIPLSSRRPDGLADDEAAAARTPMPGAAGPLLVGAAAIIGALGAPLASPIAWTPAGVAAGVSLRWGRMAGLMVLAGEAVGGLVTRQPAATIAAGTLAAASSTLLFVLMLRGFGFRRGLPRLHDVVLFVGCALVAATPAAAIASWAPQPTPFPVGWMYACITLMVGALPFVAVTSRALADGARQRWTTAALGVALAAVLAAMLLRVPGMQWVALVGLLLVIIGAIRLGIAFSCLGVAALAIAHSTGALLGLGPEALGSNLREVSHLWSYVVILVAVALSVHALLAEREASERRLRETLAEERIGMLVAAIREQERTGRTLQEGLGRDLAALALQVRELETRARRDAPAAVADITEMALGCERAQQQVDAVSQGLTPPIADDGDLLAALQVLANRVSAAAGTAVTVHADPGLRLPVESCRDVYRIAQEALTNALKHAGARNVRIELRRGPADGTEVVIADDGRGMKLPQPGMGIGLRTMEHRAAMCGGSFRVEAPPGRGTRVICSVPRRRPAAVQGTSPLDTGLPDTDSARLVALGATP